jgi:hypothetical protein
VAQVGRFGNPPTIDNPNEKRVVVIDAAMEARPVDVDGLVETLGRRCPGQACFAEL